MQTFRKDSIRYLSRVGRAGEGNAPSPSICRTPDLKFAHFWLMRNFEWKRQCHGIFLLKVFIFCYEWVFDFRVKRNLADKYHLFIEVKILRRLNLGRYKNSMKYVYFRRPEGVIQCPCVEIDFHGKIIREIEWHCRIQRANWRKTCDKKNFVARLFKMPIFARPDTSTFLFIVKKINLIFVWIQASRMQNNISLLCYLVCDWCRILKSNYFLCLTEFVYAMFNSLTQLE